MALRLRLGNAFVIEMALDSTWGRSLILAACTLVSLACRAHPFASCAAVTFVGVAAAIGVFASLAVDERAHEVVAGARACAGLVPERRPATTGRSRRGALES